MPLCFPSVVAKPRCRSRRALANPPAQVTAPPEAGTPITTPGGTPITTPGGTPITTPET